jgi:hypothetical protein
MLRWPNVARTSVLLYGTLVLMGCRTGVVHLGDGRNANDGGVICPHAQIKANEVTWIGDTWVTVPGTQYTRVRNYAREIGAIDPDGDYIIAAAAGASMAATAEQYQNQESSPTKVKVLIIAGGTWDTIRWGATDAVISDVVATFRQLLIQVAMDGTVQHIVYYLCPELPGIPGVSTLRPLLKQECADSAVPCNFLDLQPLWAGHPEYTSSTGFQASEDGAKVIADEIWDVMQKNCIAQ